MNTIKKNLIATLMALSSLASCTSVIEKQISDDRQVKFASFNVSFAHDGDPSEHFDQWVRFMNMPVARQNHFIKQWHENTLSSDQRSLAERVIQIRNVAAIIQKVRPDVLLLNEFNNDGEGKNNQALVGFLRNYLAVSQSLNSVDGGEWLEPITYPYIENYATNTGLNAGIDLNNNGYSKNDPNDAYGFGFYHGHYAFALLSKFEIDSENTRTFQTFKRKDLPDAVNPKIVLCDGKSPIPEGMKCGDTWFSEQQWQTLRLSSKNHVDAPIRIPTPNGTVTVNALLSHPTPPAFDTVTDNNKYRNSAENLFWYHYLNGHQGIYDDAGKSEAFNGESFVIMGDLNADITWGTTTDPRFNGIQQLMAHERVHKDVAQLNGAFIPTSLGALEEPNRRQHPHPQIRTATFGSRVDYAVPSANLKVIDSGVYWAAEHAPGRLLFNDKRIGKRGADKEVSSDHRLVWVTVEL
ncbi:endonuclease/exonuclease/phosphatase family protein [Alteromonas sediminis]|uniref:Endonuclease/exonuclease/phosphatase family protein n=1 Tax=Alteromonas sediminis TaxID=2259342 RepID=A0A3N5YFA5_9ALTE|nr:endonuclease/exonuclease/phosphatase family protein [Alteromonas sediminis]RPJ68675.1 endonuclease/exonuclease/phosphatase family protein [Alteromonas sediminis]